MHTSQKPGRWFVLVHAVVRSGVRMLRVLPHQCQLHLLL